MRILAIDPGYRTLGATALGFDGVKFKILGTRAFNNAKGFDSTEQQIDLMIQGVSDFAREFGHFNLLATEHWRGGQNAGTAYWRGRFDAHLDIFARLGGTDTQAISNSAVKAILNPLGKATSPKKKTDTAIEMMLAQVAGWLVDQSDLEMLRKPTLWPDSVNRWASGKEHVLDSFAIGILAVLKTYASRDLPLPPMPEVHKRVFDRLVRQI